MTSSKAIAALIFAFFFCPAGLVLGLRARREIDQSAGRLQGRDLATAAIILSSIFLVLSVLGGLVGAWLMVQTSPVPVPT
ncbi:MAG: DUF4190 domain-containing protein [Myxococcales bacterium]